MKTMTKTTQTSTSKKVVLNKKYSVTPTTTVEETYLLLPKSYISLLDKDND